MIFFSIKPWKTEGALRSCEHLPGTSTKFHWRPHDFLEMEKKPSICFAFFGEWHPLSFVGKWHESKPGLNPQRLFNLRGGRAALGRRCGWMGTDGGWERWTTWVGVLGCLFWIATLYAPSLRYFWGWVVLNHPLRWGAWLYCCYYSLWYWNYEVVVFSQKFLKPEHLQGKKTRQSVFF